MYSIKFNNLLYNIKDISQFLESDSPAKKKVAAYKLSKEASSLIKEDEANKKLWEEAVQHTKEGGQVRVQQAICNSEFHWSNH